MHTLSKTIQLGVIVLALRWLGKLNFLKLRLISRAAKSLGVSRKAGYEAAERLEKLLAAPQPEAELALRREVLLLRIRNQVLTYERDHQGVRFSRRRHHLPLAARSLCVRILRDFKEKLSEADIASALGVPLSNLKRWDSEADLHSDFPSRPDGRGSHRRASAEDARRVVEEFRNLPRSMTLEEFTEHFKAKYPKRALDRRTITRILQAEGLVKITTTDSTPPYHDHFKVYFPGAQVAVDATETKVVFTGQSPKTITLKREVAIDIATCAILGDSLGKQETADGVERVLVQARKECVSMLAILSDNGSANRSGRIEALPEVTPAGHIFSFPYHPQTNGHLEGLFGQFSRIAGTIEIDDTSRDTIARSVEEAIFRIFNHFHNHSPRKRLGGMSPLRYFHRYSKPLREKLDAARNGLHKQKERSEALRRPHPRLCDPPFRSLVKGILERLRLGIELEDALKALLPYDNKVIDSSSAAFFSQSRRDGFDERKRTFAYFMGIVKNKQKDIDQARVREELEAQRARRFRHEQAALARQLREEQQQEEHDLKHQPERVVLKYSELLVAGELRIMRRTWFEKVRRGLEALQRLGRLKSRLLDELSGTIRSWGKYRENLKEQMIALLKSEYDALCPP